LASSGNMIELAIRCVDLTSLEADDTEERILALCERALRPDPDDAASPPVAAVCVYPRFVRAAAVRLAGTPVRVAAVAGGFPSGVATVEERVEEIRSCIASGAHEIDTVLDRMALGAAEGESGVLEQLRASREAAAGATLKVILETGALESPGLIRRAAELAIDAGADFLKTSTGKVGLGASPGAAREVMQVAGEAFRREGRLVGIKVAGGVRRVDDALGYLEIAREVLGPDWLTPQRFRIGASSLLDALVAEQRARGA
jgi:deoxyribose-phosphate aldolase